MKLTQCILLVAGGSAILLGQSKWNPKDALQKATGKPAASDSTPATPAATPVPSTAVAAPVLTKGPVKGTLRGQGAEMTMCDKMAKDPASRWDSLCANPAKVFEYKGSVTNVGATFKFDPPMTSRGVQFKVQLYKDNVLQEYREITFNTGGKTSQITMTVPPGTYQMKLVDQFDPDQIALVDTFVVAKDKIGDRAVDNVASGTGKLMVCSEIDDNWKCVNESTTWKANVPFNLYVRLPQAISGQVAGWAIFKQLPDGTDGIFVTDLLQGTNGRAAYWATTNGNTLPAGKYTIYSIAWANRATIGNLKQYFAKTTLTVK